MIGGHGVGVVVRGGDGLVEPLEVVGQGAGVAVAQRSEVEVAATIGRPAPGRELAVQLGLALLEEGEALGGDQVAAERDAKGEGALVVGARRGEELVEALAPGDRRIYNLGIGKGYSVKEIVDAVKRIVDRPFRVDTGARRPGDPPALYADASKIEKELGWKARRTDIGETILSAWRWFSAHPDGYDD